jgi:hypothetical protein
VDEGRNGVAVVLKHGHRAVGLRPVSQ